MVEGVPFVAVIRRQREIKFIPILHCKIDVKVYNNAGNNKNLHVDVKF